jgi:hypothetical protein
LASSTHGITSGQPYTVADDENTICTYSAPCCRQRPCTGKRRISVEQDVLYLHAAVLLHGLVEVDGADEVVVVVHVRVRDALPHGLQPGEVDYGVVPGETRGAATIQQTHWVAVARTFALGNGLEMRKLRR